MEKLLFIFLIFVIGCGIPFGEITTSHHPEKSIEIDTLPDRLYKPKNLEDFTLQNIVMWHLKRETKPHKRFYLKVKGNYHKGGFLVFGRLDLHF